MAFIPVSGAGEIRISGNLPLGKTYQTTVHCDISATGGLTQAVVDNFMLLLHDAYTTSTLNGTLHTAWTLSEITVTDLTTAAGAQFHSVLHPLVGGFGGEPLPTQTAALVRLETNTRGGSYRGRWYHGGFTETSSTGHVISTTLTQLQGMVEDWIASMAGANAPLVIVSRYHGTHLVSGPWGQVVKRPLPRAAGIMTPIVTPVAEAGWATIRRRRAV
jgi:hypothetical protein